MKRAAVYHAPELPGRSAPSFHRGGVFTAPSRPESKPAAASDAYRDGAVVEHPKFGKGKIISTNGEGGEKIAVVRFDTAGEKKMFVAFAPLKILQG